MSRALLAILCLGLAVGVLVLGALLVCPGGHCTVPALDRAGLTLAYASRSRLLDGSMALLTWLGSLWLLLPASWLAAVLLWRSGFLTEARLLVVALPVVVLLAYTSKALVARPRPDLYPVLGELPSDWSFPSAHTMQITIMALLVLVLAWRWLPPLGAALLALLMLGLVAVVGWSRIHLQVHFPSDVLAGMLASLLCGLALVVYFDPQGSSQPPS